MGNIIKYSESTSPNSIKSGNFNVGVNNTPTDLTGFFDGISPIIGGYTIYINKASNGPSIYAPKNDTELIQITNSLGGSVETAEDALTWINSQSTMTVINNNYPSIVTDGLVLNLDAGFVSSYPKTGTTWKDLSGNGYNGTLVNGVSYSSQNYGTLVFDGVDDYVRIDEVIVDSPTSLTIGGWFKRNGDGANYEAALHQSINTSIGSSSYWFGLQTSTNNIVGTIGSNTGVGWSAGLTNITANVGVWYYVVSTWDGSSVKTYVNGILEKTYSLSSYNNLTTPTRIGASGDGNGYLMNADISNIFIYQNKFFTPEEVRQNYQAGLQRFISTDGLVLSLDAQNTNLYAISPTTAYDVSGNDNNGILTNGVQYVSDGNGSWKFDGVNDIVNLGTGNTFFPLPQFTINIWFKSSGTVATTGVTPGLFGFTYGIRAHLNETNLLFGVDNGTGITNLTIPGTFRTDNTWYNVTFYHTGTNMGIYINGSLRNSTNSLWSGTSRWPTDSWNLGRDNNNNNQFFFGQISSCKIYNRVLEEEEILTIYNATKSRYGL